MNISLNFKVIVCLLISFCLLPDSYASTGELFGFGSQASALGNTMLSGTRQSTATFYNPAVNSKNPGLQLQLGLAYAQFKFIEIPSVTVGNYATTGDSTDRKGNIDTEYLNLFGQVFSASYNLGENFWNGALGITAFLPIERVGYLDTGEPFKPEYFNYRSRTQRPQIYASLSLSPFDYLYFAAGVAIALNLNGNVSMTLSTAQNSISYSRFSSTIKSGASPYFSVYTDPGPFEFGATVRMESITKMNLDTAANTRILGPTASVSFLFNSSSSMYYDPFEIDLGASYAMPANNWLFLEADWFQYSKFKAPVLFVSNTGTANFQNSITVTPAMDDIIVPKIGFEHRFEKLTTRLGFVYRPSPVKDNSGNGNLVDPTKHIFTAGLGVDLSKLHITEKSISLDLHGQYHRLIKKQIVKSPGNELGDLTQSKIGSPGYDIGGKILAFGLSVSTEF